MTKQAKNTELVKVVEEFHLTETDGNIIKERFLPFLDKLDEWKKKVKTLVVTDESQKDKMQDAREGRLMLKRIRVDAEKTKTELKADSLRYGKAVQGMYNIILHQIKPMEEHLQKQEDFVKIREEEKKAALIEVREKDLEPYVDFIPLVTYDQLGDMSEEQFQLMMSGAKTQKKEKEDAEKKAEEDRIRKENEQKAQNERRERLWGMGLKWDGQSFTYEDINFHWTDVVCMTDEEFNKQVEGAEKRKLEIDAAKEAKEEFNKKVQSRKERLLKEGINFDTDAWGDDKQRYSFESVCGLPDEEFEEVFNGCLAIKEKIRQDKQKKEEKERKERERLAKQAADLKKKEDERKQAEAAKEKERKALAAAPDKDKLLELVTRIDGLELPDLDTEDAQNILVNVKGLLSKVSSYIVDKTSGM